MTQEKSFTKVSREMMEHGKRLLTAAEDKLAFIYLFMIHVTFIICDRSETDHKEGMLTLPDRKLDHHRACMDQDNLRDWQLDTLVVPQQVVVHCQEH